MDRLSKITLSVFLGLFLISTAYAAERVVVCEETYAES